MKLYMRVSDDKYELPEAVAESPEELARMLRVKKRTVLSNISRQKNREKPRYIKIEVED